MPKKTVEMSPEEIYQLHYFTKDVIGIYASKNLSQSRKYSRQQTRKFLQNPFDNYLKLQEIDKELTNISGNYYRLKKYLSNLLTFDYVLYPYATNKKFEDSDKISKAFEDSALYLDKMNIKYNFRYITERLIGNGEIFLYKLEDTKSIIYKEIPNKICRISLIDDGVYRYEVDLSKITNDMLADMPLEIQNAYNNQSSNSKKKKVDSTGISWYQVSNNGFAFNLIGNYQHGYPPLSFLFDDVMALEEISDDFEDQLKLDSIKLIHQKVPLNEDNTPAMPKEVVETYHESTKRNLPKGIAITTNPLELESINLEKTASKRLDGLQIAEHNLFANSGVSKLLFNNESNSGEGLKKSLATDEMLMYPLLYMYANYINKELKNINSVYFCKIKFLECTYFNRDEKLKLARESMANGGSRLNFLAYSGYEPIEAVNLLKMEKSLNIDDILIPKKDAHTLSGEDNQGGAPTKDDVSDKGDASRDSG